MNMTSELDNLIAAIQAAGQPSTVTEHDSYALVPVGYTLQSLERFHQAPARKRGLAKHATLTSFTAYVKEHATEDTRIFLDRLTGAATAYLDFHREHPSWMEHVATWIPQPSPSLAAWQGINGKALGQSQFADFAEDHLPDFISPPGGEMMDIITTLTATGQLNFRQAIRLDNSTVRLAYEETVEARAGQKGELLVPQAILLGIELFPGLESASHVPARLRYRLNSGQLTFTVKLDDLDRLKTEAAGRIAAQIHEATGLPVFYGEFQIPAKA